MTIGSKLHLEASSKAVLIALLFHFILNVEIGWGKSNPNLLQSKLIRIEFNASDYVANLIKALHI